MSAKYRKKAFTLIELIITIALLGILLIPLGIMSMEFTKEIAYSRDAGVAEGLAKVEMAKINNLTYADVIDYTGLEYEGYPYDLYRTVSYVDPPTNSLKKVQVKIYLSGNTTRPLVNAITYVANVSFGAGSGGGSAGNLAANYLLVTGGSIYNSGVTHQLRNVTIQNTNPSASITVTGIEISFTGASGIRLQQVRMNATDGIKNRVTGFFSSPTGLLTLTPAATLAANTSYANTVFLNFNNRTLTAVTSLVFTMSDGSKTTDYSWP